MSMYVASDAILHVCAAQFVVQVVSFRLICCSYCFIELDRSVHSIVVKSAVSEGGS